MGRPLPRHHRQRMTGYDTTSASSRTSGDNGVVIHGDAAAAAARHCAHRAVPHTESREAVEPSHRAEVTTLVAVQQRRSLELKGEKTTMPCPGSVARRKLADISNVPQKSRPSFQDDKPQSISRTTKEFIDQLQKEHLALVTMLAQRNKIIERSGIELERLRVNLLKMQEQNQQLALSNTQMLAELNSGKDRLRALQHELGCKNGLLKARQLQLEEKARTKSCQDVDAEVNLIKYEKPGESLKEDRGDKEPRNTRKRSQSYCSSEQVQSKDKAEKKRSSVRRQSARFKADEKEPAEDLFKIRDARFPVCSLPDDPVLENNSISVSEAVNNEVEECISAPIYETQQFGRSSLGRPSRQAAKMVQSYKEIPLNVKMRRT